MKNKLERRVFPFELEVKADDETGKFVGHAAVFDEIGEGMFFREKISPGAFKASIRKDDIRALRNHNSDYVLGRNRAKPTPTLNLKEDDIGLKVTITPPDTQWARDLRESIRRGDINQMSFAFETLKDSWDEEDELRTLEKVKLWEVSTVTFPFYEGTDIAVRTREDIWNQRKSEKGNNRLWQIDARGREIELMRMRGNLS